MACLKLSEWLCALFYAGRKNGVLKSHCNSDKLSMWKSDAILSWTNHRISWGKVRAGLGKGGSGILCVFHLKVIASSPAMFHSHYHLRVKSSWFSRATNTALDFKHAMAEDFHSSYGEYVYIYLTYGIQWKDTYTLRFPWFKHCQSPRRWIHIPIAKGFNFILSFFGGMRSPCLVSL